MTRKTKRPPPRIRGLGELLAEKTPEAPEPVVAEIGGGGIENARTMNAGDGTQPLIKQPAFLVALALIPLVYMTAAAVLFGAGFSEEVKVIVVTAIVSGLTGSISGFFWGSSYTTSRSRGLNARP
jgi:hypothetical protein